MADLMCPVCGLTNSVVWDSRTTHRGHAIWRRRKCPASHRFTTMEIVEPPRNAQRALAVALEEMGDFPILP